MKYFATWWESGGGKTYAQILDEKPTDEFEKGKNDFYSEELDIGNIRSLVGDATGYPDDEAENESFSRLINALQSGEKIELDNYYK